MPNDHTFFTVEQITRSNYAIRYTPRPVKDEAATLQFSMAFDMLVAGESLADKQQSLQQIANILNTEANKP